MSTTIAYGFGLVALGIVLGAFLTSWSFLKDDTPTRQVEPSKSDPYA